MIPTKTERSCGILSQFGLSKLAQFCLLSFFVGFSSTMSIRLGIFTALSIKDGNRFYL